MVETGDDFAARGDSGANAYADGDADSGVAGSLAVLGLPVALTSWRQATSRIEHWAAAKDPRIVCICNAHSVVTATRNPHFRRVIIDADMATPDGAPVAWLMRRLGARGQDRIDGPGLMWRLCGQAAQNGLPVFLYGGRQSTLDLLVARLESAHPGLIIAGAESPPFRDLTPDEDAAVVQRIAESEAGLVFVSLGCPKQELWMDDHRDSLSAVLIGVGAAFEYHAGTLRRAPVWMQRHGLEWAFRLAMEPRRLWRRYLVTNTWFLVLATRELLGHWMRRQVTR
jgi:N-acetylglucosaminyldiphosphoundecaprenol N-acetyl-beta-D-mannosaminyltransferase